MKKNMLLAIGLVMIICLYAQAVTLSPTDDAFVDETQTTTPLGDRDYLIIRRMSLTGFRLHTLIRFDLSSVPSGAMINSANLNLHYYLFGDSDPVGRPLQAHRITASWSEDTVTWNNQPGYDATPVASTPAPASYGWIQWDVRGDAQDFINGTYSNYGWKVMDFAPTNNSMIYFRSKEYADSNYAPYLEVEYGRIYVDANATGADNGSSWTDAFNYLQDALATAISGEEIWVAEGTYKPDQGGGKTPGDANATFQLINGVELYGGFAGGETSLEQRDWENNVTILSGDIGVADSNSDNSYHVVTGSATNSTAVIDGFTITQGNARGSGITRSGGGMYNYQGSPKVINCTFVENIAQFYGGGMYNDYNSNANVLKCTFSENIAVESGGGLANDGSSPMVINCFFKDNYVTNSGGGGMFNNEASSPVLINCAFVNNSAAGSGGGIRNRGEENEDCCPTLVNCSFGGNWAGSTGGGMYTGNEDDECDPVVTNCVFWGNTSDSGSVQAAQIDGDSPIVTYSCIQDSDPDDGSIPFGGAANNNIDDNPLFENQSGGDLRLSPGSPCIEVGSNTAVPADILDIDEDGNTTEPTPLDLDERSRLFDGDCADVAVVDMGAYEFRWVYAGDLDGDCDVDLGDLAIMCKHWLAGK